jgi:hypothetical protein
MILTTLGAAFLFAGSSVPARAGIHVSISLPVEIVATDTPVYYEGRACYWYGDRWYYRVRGDWYEYREEPVYLRDYRDHHARERRFYGRYDDRWERHERWEEERRREERQEEHRREERREERREHWEDRR